MSALSRALRARRVTFVVHVVVGLASVLASAPIAAMLEAAVRDHPEGDALLVSRGGAAWVDIAYEWGDALRAGLVVPILVGALVALVSGPMTCGWIAALASRDHGPIELVRDTFGSSVRAWLLEGMLLATRVLVVGIAVGAGLLVAAIAIAAGSDDRIVTLASMGAGSVVALGLVPIGAAADAARAEIAVRRARSHVAWWRGMVSALGSPIGTTAPYALLAAIGLVLAAVALFAGESFARTGVLSAPLVLVVQQALLLARTFVRSIWLARCAGRIAISASPKA